MSWELDDKQGPKAPSNPHPAERAWESGTPSTQLEGGGEDGGGSLEENGQHADVFLL